MAKASATNKSAKRRASRTDRARATFIDTLRETCNVSAAARAAGIGRRTAYDWRDADSEFAKAWEDAEEEAVDALEEAARNRALDNSDRMMEILLKAHRPEKYVERVRSELTGKDGGPVEYRNLSDEEVDARIRAHEEARAKQSAAK